MPDVGTILDFAAGGTLDDRVRIVAVILTAVMLGIVLELARRRRLVERYALLWMIVALSLLVLATVPQLLNLASDAIGIAVPANALFGAAFAVAFLMLLHFSVITSRLSEETKILAQEVARLDTEVRALRAAQVNGEAGETAAPDARGPQAESQRDKSARTSDQ